MNGQDELRELWCSVPPLKTTKGENMLAIVQRKTSRFDRLIVVRNSMECIAAGAVAVMFTVFAFKAHNALVRAGCLVIAASSVWIIYFMLRYGKGPSGADPNLNLLEYTQALANRYDYQIRLLKSVKYWYLLPPYLGLVLGTVGLFQERASSGALSWFDFIWPGVYTAVYAATWWLNEVYSVGRLRKERAKLLALAVENVGSVE